MWSTVCEEGQLREPNREQQGEPRGWSGWGPEPSPLCVLTLFGLEPGCGSRDLGPGPGWDPKTSSLLQVFMSIQALVLVEEPYFNEPGFEKLKGTAEGTRNSQMYSENAILLGLQSLIALKSRPPTGFVGIIKLYYKEKGAAILARFQQTVGGSETGFALTLGKRYLPRLEALFAKI